eukprot:9497572-Pyramimonas_sp.AAC.1
MNFRGHRMSGYNGNTTLDGELPSDGITVLSLFDGISGAGAALHKAGVKVARVIVAEVETVTPRPSNTPVTPRHAPGGVSHYRMQCRLSGAVVRVTQLKIAQHTESFALAFGGEFRKSDLVMPSLSVSAEDCCSTASSHDIGRTMFKVL